MAFPAWVKTTMNLSSLFFPSSFPSSSRVICQGTEHSSEIRHVLTRLALKHGRRGPGRDGHSPPNFPHSFPVRSGRDDPASSTPACQHSQFWSWSPCREHFRGTHWCLEGGVIEVVSFCKKFKNTHERERATWEEVRSWISVLQSWSSVPSTWWNRSFLVMQNFMVITASTFEENVSKSIKAFLFELEMFYVFSTRIRFGKPPPFPCFNLHDSPSRILTN